MPSLPLSRLQEILALPWCQHIHGAAYADDINENGWIVLPPSTVGTVYLRQGHAQYADGLALVIEPDKDRDIWTFLLKQDDAGRSRVEVYWREGHDHDCELVQLSETRRYSRACQHLEQLAIDFIAQDAHWRAACARTNDLTEQASRAGPDAAPWQRWWGECRDMQALAMRRGWRVTPLLATPPAAESELAAVEQAHGLPIPAQLRTLLSEVAADVYFGWRCSRDDEPTGKLSSLYSGGIRDTLWSLRMIHHYALANFDGWREYHCGAEAFWDKQFAFAHLINGDALTIDTSDPDPMAQPVRYFSHESDGERGAVLAPNLYAFYETWCALGCAGNEQHDWWNLRDRKTGYLNARSTVAKQWRAWLQRDPNLRKPDEAPRPLLARSAADCAWLDAARNQDIQALQKALAQGARVDCSPDDWRDENHTALIYAVQNDNLPMLQWLHAHGASLSTTLLSTYVAVRYAQPATLQWLIEHGARVDRWREQRFCPLHELISSGRTSDEYRALMTLLLKAGSDPNAEWDLESGTRTTALMRVGPWGTERLLAAGADPHVRDANGCNALHHAEQPEVIAMLAKAGLDPNDLSTPEDDQPGMTPLQYALRRNCADETVPALLVAGADPHRTDTLGRNAWFYCFDAHCVDLLLDMGFDVNAQDGEGKTVLHHLLIYTRRLYDRYLATAERLIQRGFKLDIADREGNTLLHLMAHEYDGVHDRGSLEFLLDQGADRSLRNLKGQQAWQRAGRKHNAAIALLKPVSEV
jgi:ankyrin repeat protein